MTKRNLLRWALAGLFSIAAGSLPACQSVEKPQALTGQAPDRAKPRYVPHGKGQQWGRVVYDRH